MAIKGMKPLDFTAYILLVAGGITWGTQKFLSFNLVDWITNMTMPLVGTVVYAAVGLSGIYALYTLFK